MSVILAVLLGFATPVQTGINNRLREKIGTPFGAALVSFVVGNAALLAAVLILEHSTAMFPESAKSAPWWLWLGGLIGAAFVIANILLIPVLGAAQTAILPIAGQLVMSLLIDHYAWIFTSQISLTVLRALGAAATFVGIVLVTLTKSREPSGAGSGHSPLLVWVCRILSVAVGMLSAVQTAINGYLGVVMESALKGALMSFAVGTVFVLILNICLYLNKRRKKNAAKADTSSAARTEQNHTVRAPWWIWFGGIFGAIYILGTVYMTGILGVGVFTVAVIAGTTVCGVLIDAFGFFGVPKKQVTLRTVIGLALVICGAALVKLF